MPYPSSRQGLHRALPAPGAHRAAWGASAARASMLDFHRPRRRRLAKPSILGSLLALVVGFILVAPNANATTLTYIGAAGDETGLSQKINAPLARHSYAHFSSGVPAGQMITVEASGSWASVASAGPGTAVYNDIVRWADTIKTRPGQVLLAYHHEPEASYDTKLGTSADFIRAFRHVVTIFRNRGVKNVVYTWQMTAWSFRTSPSDSRYAPKWYPGDAYVNTVGADAYNWYTCGHGKGRWQELSYLGDPVLAFARAHAKKASFPEFASTAASARAQWLINAHKYLVASRGTVQAAFYFQRGPTVSANSDCKWPLTTSAEFKAYGDIARDTSYFRT